VEIESPLTIVRGLLADLENLALRARNAYGVIGLLKVDEVEWSGGRGEQTIGSLIQNERERIRAELASACGLAEIYADLRGRASPTSRVEIY
jgi:hypothetical protein